MFVTCGSQTLFCYSVLFEVTFTDSISLHSAVLPYESIGRVPVAVLLSSEPIDGYAIKSVMHGQCVTRPTVTFLASELHFLLTATKLYCRMTEAHRCK